MPCITAACASITTSQWMQSAAAITPDGAMTLVYLTGPNWCGSGGCRLLVLDRTGEA